MRPPQGFFTRSYKLEEIGKTIIKSPVKQLVTTPGVSGVYDVDLLEIRNLTIRQVYEHAMKNKCEECDMEAREKRFWRSLGVGTGGEGSDPIYGADILGSLFQNKTASGMCVLSHVQLFLYAYTSIFQYLIV